MHRMGWIQHRSLQLINYWSNIKVEYLVNKNINRGQPLGLLLLLFYYLHITYIICYLLLLKLLVTDLWTFLWTILFIHLMWENSSLLISITCSVLDVKSHLSHQHILNQLETVVLDSTFKCRSAMGPYLAFFCSCRTYDRNSLGTYDNFTERLFMVHLGCMR